MTRSFVMREAVAAAALALCGSAALAQPTPPPGGPPPGGPPAMASGISPPPADPLPAGWGPHGKPLYYFMVFGNAAPGKDKELNDWYDRIHAPMMIEHGEFVWAQRFMVSPVQFGGAGNKELLKRRYMVIFALETNDIKAASAEANARMMAPRNIASRSLDYRTLTSITFEALGPPTTQKQAQAMLKAEEAKGTVPKPGQPAPPGSYNPMEDMRAANGTMSPPPLGTPPK